jgi:multidrug efflux pump subunit AcrA (membrane-fusion protein)
MGFIRILLTWVGRHRWTSFIVLLCVAISLFGIREFRVRSQGSLSEPLQRGTIIESVYGIGTVLSNRSFQIKPGVISTIDALYVREGDSVKRGAPLVRLDKVVYRAPFAGTVTYLPFKVGENIFAQVPLLTLVDLKDRYLVVSFEQQGALRIRAGQKATLSFDTIRQQNYIGVVQSVYSNESNFLARIDVSGLPPMILPGMTADVAIEIRRHDQALMVPAAALISGHTVWVKRGSGLPKKVDVQVGIVDKSQAEIVGGDVQAGDRVLVKSRDTS